MFRPSAYQVAVLLLTVPQRAGARRATASRWKFSGRTIRKISRRESLRRSFLDELSYELEELGFVLIELPSGSFGLIAMDAVEGWTRLSARERLDDVFDLSVSKGPDAFSAKVHELATALPKRAAQDASD